MEEVDGVVWGNSGCGTSSTTDYLGTPGRTAYGVRLPVPGKWRRKCYVRARVSARFRHLLGSGLLLAPSQKAEGKFWQRHVGARCRSRPDGGQPSTRLTLASSCPRRSAQGAWLDDTAKSLCNCRGEKPTIGISPSGAVASRMQATS